MAQDTGDDKELAARLRQLLKDRGWTQGEMANNCGISKRAVETYLSGTSPRADALRKIARGANVSVDWLLFGSVNLVDEDRMERAINAAAFRAFYNFIGTVNGELGDESRRLMTLDYLREKIGELASVNAQRVTERALRYMNEEHVNHSIEWPSDTD